MGLGTWEWAIILVIVFVVFGAGKLPDVFRQAGKGIKAFKDASEGKDEEKDDKGKDEKAKEDAETEEERAERLRRREAARQIGQKADPDDLDDDPKESVSSTQKKGEAG